MFDIRPAVSLLRYENLMPHNKYMIKYIFFDIDNTLFPTSEFAELARKNAIRAMIELGLPFTNSEKLYSRLLKIIVRCGSNSDQHFNELLKELKINKPARFIAAAVAAYHNTKTGILPFPEIPLVLLQLRERGYKLYVATDGNAIKQWDKLIRLGIALYFEDVFVSEEIGTKKSRQFFAKVLGGLKIKPVECVMVGDREEKDILPAKSAGMRTILMRGRQGQETKSDADVVINDFCRLPDIIKKV